MSKSAIENIEQQAIFLKKQGKLSEVEIIAKLEKSNKRLLKPHLYAKLPDGLVEDILHLRNKKVTLALEQIRYEEWLHGQGKRSRRVLERLRKETSLLDRKVAQRVVSVQGSLVSSSQFLSQGLDKGPVGEVKQAPSQEPVVGPSPKSPLKDPVEIQLEGIKVLYDHKIFYGKFDKHVVKPGN